MSIPDLLYALLFSPLGGLLAGGVFLLVTSALICAEKEEW